MKKTHRSPKPVAPNRNKPTNAKVDKSAHEASLMTTNAKSHVREATATLRSFARRLEVFFVSEGDRFVASSTGLDSGIGTVRLLWDVIVHLDRAMRALGVTREKGEPFPEDSVGLWIDLLVLGCPSRVRPLVREIHGCGAVIGLRQTQYAKSKADDGIRIVIPREALAWAVHTAEHLEHTFSIRHREKPVDLVGMTQAADAIDVAPTTVRSWINAGRLDAWSNQVSLSEVIARKDELVTRKRQSPSHEDLPPRKGA